ncbi:hypothetical protein Aperf_G00000043362 [Anoplocephala perfoliata]
MPALKRSDSDISDVVYERRVLKYIPPEIRYVDWREIIDIFEEIDQDRKGYITRSELTEYFRSHLTTGSNVYKWFQWFEGEHKGIITMEDVCTTLGIPMRKEYTQKVDRTRSMISEGIIPVPVEAPKLFASIPPVSNSKSIMDGVEVLHMNFVTEEMLQSCVRSCKENSSNLKEAEIAKILKEYMERLYKKHWVVIVASSTIGCAVAHETNMFIHFRYSNRIYILYRIPDMDYM